LCQLFEQIRCQILTQKRDENVVREEVLKMRQKMKDHLGSSSEQKTWHFSFKTGCRWYR
jgi:glutamate-ammonia-ligase adenylyltransferase